MSRVTKVTGIVAIMALVVAVAPAIAADASASLDVNSAYVFRGVERSDELAVHPTVAVNSGSLSITTWAWWDTDAASETDFAEVDLSVAYALPVEAVGLSIGWTEYLYTDGTASDREISLSISELDLPLSPVVSIAVGLEGAKDSDLYVNLAVSHEMPVGDSSLTITAAAGWMDDDSTGESGTADGSVNATLSMSVSESTTVSAQIEYNTTLSDDVIPDTAAFDDVWGGVSVSRAL